MIAIGKPYNALTGAELKKTILSEVERALDRVGINSVAITYPLASWSWTLTLLQRDAEGHAASETPELVVEAGHPEQIAEARNEPATEPPSKLIRSLQGGSKRFKTNPPPPTEVRQAEGMPVPEG